MCEKENQTGPTGGAGDGSEESIPMDVEVILLPSQLRRPHLANRTVVVFDVLRATTTMAAALAAGVVEIRVFGSIDEARQAEARHTGALRVLCGEEKCLPPPGFDLGNSPGAFGRDLHAGHTAFMSTTNGTRAILAATGGRTVITGALVNASAAARAVAGEGSAATLLCAGTGGQVAMEDVIGAGAVIERLSKLVHVSFESDVAVMALRLFRGASGDLRAALAESQGGRNVIAAGLDEDIDFAARLDALDVVGRVRPEPLAVVPAA